MGRTFFDMRYGAKRLDDRSMIKVENAVTPTLPMFFNGIPVYFSDISQKHIYNKKQWKRLGRPDKIRVRDKMLPAVTVTNIPLYGQCVLVHPDLKDQFIKLSASKEPQCQ